MRQNHARRTQVLQVDQYWLFLQLHEHRAFAHVLAQRVRPLQQSTAMGI
jgi:hypothetical protein